MPVIINVFPVNQRQLFVGGLIANFKTAIEELN
jgi:hypothetical protein